MFLKKLACLVLSFTMAAQPLVAAAADLDSAFGNLLGNSAVSINSPGRFQSAARTGLSLGGMEVRVPRGANTPQLLTASMPRITAGCNGISAHFGGFSFISGKEFAELLKQIASGAALGFVSAMVMKGLCPMCEAVVQELKTAAQTAAAWAKNACEIGRKFGEDFKKDLGMPDTMSLCATTSTSTNDTDDTFSAYKSGCNALKTAYEKLQDFNGTTKSNTPQGQLDAREFNCPLGAGNQTWTRLSALDDAGALSNMGSDTNMRKLLVINLMGAELGYAPNVGCEEGNGDWIADKENGPRTETESQKRTHYCKPPADLKMYAGMFLCGATPQNMGNLDGLSPAAKTYCSDYWGSAQAASSGVGPAGPQQVLSLWTCQTAPDNSAEDFTNCRFLRKVPADQIIKGEGFFIRINKLLLSAVKRVREGRGYDDEEGRQIIALIQVAPYPLYQAINAAAVYPAAASTLLDTMSVLVAEQFTHAVLDEMLRMEGRSTSTSCISVEQASRLLEFLGNLRTQNQARVALMGQNFAVQQGITEQIRQLNLTIQREVMSEDLLATGKLSQSLNRALAPTNAGAAAPMPTNP